MFKDEKTKSVCFFNLFFLHLPVANFLLSKKNAKFRSKSIGIITVK
jgi:hypothetical protein